MEATKRLWNLLSLYRSSIKTIYILAFFVGLLNLALPLGIQAIISLITVGTFTYSWLILVTLVLVSFVISGILQVRQLQIVEDIQQDVFTRSSIEFAYRIPEMDSLTLEQYHAPELVNRYFDTLTIQKGLPKILIDFSISFFQIFFGLALLLVYSQYFILFLVLLLLIFYVIYKWIVPKGIKTSDLESKYKYKLVHWLEEVARVRSNFRLFSHHRHHLKKADEETNEYLTHRRKHFKTLLFQFEALLGFRIFLGAGFLLLGSALVFMETISIGQFIASEIVVILIIGSIEKLITILETVYDVLTALGKIGYVTDIPLEEASEVEVDLQGPIKIDIENLSYRFEDKATLDLDDFSACFEPGKSYQVKALNGKSTFVNILTRSLNVPFGTVKVNEFSLTQLTKPQLAKYFGFLMETGGVFNGSIKDNILMGREHLDKELEAIIKRLDLETWVHSLPQLEKTVLDPGGLQMNALIRDRLLLARALIHNPYFLLLDNPLKFESSLDRYRLLQPWIDDPEVTVVILSRSNNWGAPDLIQVDLGGASLC